MNDISYLEKLLAENNLRFDFQSATTSDNQNIVPNETLVHQHCGQQHSRSHSHHLPAGSGHSTTSTSTSNPSNSMASNQQDFQQQQLQQQFDLNDDYFIQEFLVGDSHQQQSPNIDQFVVDDFLNNSGSFLVDQLPAVYCSNNSTTSVGNLSDITVRIRPRTSYNVSPSKITTTAAPVSSQQQQQQRKLEAQLLAKSMPEKSSPAAPEMCRKRHLMTDRSESCAPNQPQRPRKTLRKSFNPEDEQQTSQLAGLTTEMTFTASADAIIPQTMQISFKSRSSSLAYQLSCQCIDVNMTSSVFSGNCPPARKYQISQVNSLLLSASGSVSPSRRLAGGQTITNAAIEAYAQLSLYPSEQDGNDETVVSFLSPNIGQKSYGQEKRFFCPPPMISYHHGSSPNQGRVVTAQIAPDLSTSSHFYCGGSTSTIVDSKDTALAQCSLDKSPYSTSTAAPTVSSGEVLAFKTMYIGDLARLKENRSDEDLHNPILNRLYSDIGHLSKGTKRDFELFSKIQIDPCDKATANATTTTLGTFMSDRITLISKPSKKKMSKKVGREEKTCPVAETVPNEGYVSLFNRLKSQNSSTKYLLIDQSDSVAGPTPFGHNSIWQPFRISYASKIGNGFLKYRNTGGDSSIGGIGVDRIVFDEEVNLECTKSGWKSETLIVRRVEMKSLAVLPQPAQGKSSDFEYVFQLQKVALQRKRDGKYFAIDPHTGKIVYVSAKKGQCSAKRGGRAETESEEYSDSGDSDSHVVIGDKVEEHAIWSFVCVSRVDYRFYKPPADLIPADVPALPVTPVPQVTSMSLLDLSNRLSEDYHLLSLQLMIPAHSLLETMDIIYQHYGDKIMTKNGLESFMNFDVFIGSANAEIIQTTGSFHSEEEDVIPFDVFLGRKSPKSSLFSYHLQILCKCPSLHHLVKYSQPQPRPPESPSIDSSSTTVSASVNTIGLAFDRPEIQEEEDVNDWSSTILENNFWSSEEAIANMQQPQKPVDAENAESLSFSPLSNSLSLPLILCRRIDGVVYRTNYILSFNLLQHQHITHLQHQSHLQI